MRRRLIAVAIGLFTAVGAAAGLYAFCHDRMGIPGNTIARDAMVSAAGLAVVSAFSTRRRRK